MFKMSNVEHLGQRLTRSPLYSASTAESIHSAPYVAELRTEIGCRMDIIIMLMQLKMTGDQDHMLQHSRVKYVVHA